MVALFYAAGHKLTDEQAGWSVPATIKELGKFIGRCITADRHFPVFTNGPEFDKEHFDTIMQMDEEALQQRLATAFEEHPELEQLSLVFGYLRNVTDVWKVTLFKSASFTTVDFNDGPDFMREKKDDEAAVIHRCQQRNLRTFVKLLDISRGLLEDASSQEITRGALTISFKKFASGFMACYFLLQLALAVFILEYGLKASCSSVAQLHERHGQQANSCFVVDHFEEWLTEEVELPQIPAAFTVKSAKAGEVSTRRLALARFLCIVAKPLTQSGTVTHLRDLWKFPSLKELPGQMLAELFPHKLPHDCALTFWILRCLCKESSFQLLQEVEAELTAAAGGESAAKKAKTEEENGPDSAKKKKRQRKKDTKRDAAASERRDNFHKAQEEKVKGGNGNDDN